MSLFPMTNSYFTDQWVHVISNKQFVVCQWEPPLRSRRSYRVKLPRHLLGRKLGRNSQSTHRSVKMSCSDYLRNHLKRGFTESKTRTRPDRLLLYRRGTHFSKYEGYHLHTQRSNIKPAWQSSDKFRYDSANRFIRWGYDGLLRHPVEVDENSQAVCRSVLYWKLMRLINGFLTPQFLHW